MVPQSKTLLEPISKSSEEDNEAGELYKAEEVLSGVLPADEDATLPLYPGDRRAIAACNGLAVADLAWAACCDWNDAARSSQCRRFAAPHPADRCHRRDRRSNSPAWLRSCRSRSIAAPSGLRDGSPRAC